MLVVVVSEKLLPLVFVGTGFFILALRTYNRPLRITYFCAWALIYIFTAYMNLTLPVEQW